MLYILTSFVDLFHITFIQLNNLDIVVSLGELRQVFLAMKVFQVKKNVSLLFKITIYSNPPIGCGKSKSR